MVSSKESSPSMTPSMSCCLPINVVNLRGCTDIDEKVESMEQKTNILALDVGTSSTRALLFDANGAEVPGILAQESYELTLSNDGEVSVDADKLVAAVASTIDKALKAAGPLTFSIGAVATDTFWHSLVGVDTDGRPVTHVITWEDTRPRQAAAELSAQLDRRAVHERTGARLHASYWPAKLRFLAKTQPAGRRSAAFPGIPRWVMEQPLTSVRVALSWGTGRSPSAPRVPCGQLYRPTRSSHQPASGSTSSIAAAHYSAAR